MAITDNHTMTGIYVFVEQCKKRGIKPIVGITMNISPKEATYQEKYSYNENFRNLILNHGANTTLTILAKNDKGLKNLYKLLEISYDKDKYFLVPRIDLSILEQYKDNLIVLSGDFNSELAIKMRLGMRQEALDYISKMKQIFKDDFYIEYVENYGILNYNIQNFIDIADKTGTKFVFTNNVHYLNSEDYKVQELLMCVDSKCKMNESSTLNGGKRPVLGGHDNDFKTSDEIQKRLQTQYKLNSKTIETIFNNINEISNKIENYTLEYNSHLRPKIEIPPEYKDNIDYLKHLITEGFKKKRLNCSKEVQKESKKRINEELEIIKSNDFVDYFLVVEDFCNWAMNNNCPIGTGRGSAAGSEIAYLLDIHKTDPIKFNLLFERFVSPGRGATYEIEYKDGKKELLNVAQTKIVNGEKKYIYQLEPGMSVKSIENKEQEIKSVHITDAGSSPDIDTDIHTVNRKKVIEHTSDKYGDKNVAHIITFMPYKVKNAFKDMCTINNISFAVANELSKKMPSKLDCSLVDYYLSEDGQELYNFISSYITNFSNRDKLIETSSQIEINEIKSSKAYKEYIKSIKNLPIREQNEKINLYISRSLHMKKNIKIDGEYKGLRDKIEQCIKQASKITGKIKSSGVHACGVIISSEEISSSIPIQIKRDGSEDDGQVITQWIYSQCEALGLIKMDFLGLDTVDIMYNTIDLIKENQGININIVKDIINTDLDDEKVMEIFQKGETSGIFQFSGEGVQKLLREVHPTEFEELAAITALYRPGPMGIGLHTDFAKRKNDTNARLPIHKDFYGTKVEEILEPTLNALTFQEQIMQISKQCAGFTSKEADKLRKAISKKNIKLMESMEKKFKDGMKDNKEDSYSEEAINMLWDGFVSFGEYAFNKCLHYETKILLKDYSETSIEELYKKYGYTPEDLYLLSYFESENNLKPHKVKHITMSGEKTCYKITTKFGRQIALTKEHRMLTNNGYKTIENNGLNIGTLLYLYDKNKNKIIKDKIVKIEFSNKKVRTYDIEMEDNGPHNFIANGLVSHNSHSCSYALNGYILAYLKTYYPLEFMTAVIKQRINENDKDETEEALKELKRLSLELVPPNINLSTYEPSLYKGKILFGLNGIKGLNTKAVKAILKERNKNGNFKSFDDFLHRCKDYITKSILQTLATAGCFDCFGLTRKSVYDDANNIIKLNEKTIKTKEKLSNSLFALINDNNTADLAQIKINNPEEEWSYLEKLNREKELLSTYLSGQPLQALVNDKNFYRDKIKHGVLDTYNQNNGKKEILFIEDIEKLKKGVYKLSVNNYYYQENIKLTKKQSKTLDKAILINKYREQLEIADDDFRNKIYKKIADEIGLSIEEMLKLDDWPIIEKNKVYSIIVSYKEIKSSGYKYYELHDIVEIPLSKNGTRLYAVNINSKEKNKIEKIKTFLEKQKGKDSIRLQISSTEYFDIDNIEFIPGTTQQDISRILEGKEVC